MKRVVLLETVNDEPHRHHRAEFFPYVLGLLRRRGWPAEWWSLQVPRAFVHAGGRFVVDLPPDQRERLLRALTVAPPDVLVCNDRPAPALAVALAAAAPATRVVDLVDVVTPDETTEGAILRFLAPDAQIDPDDDGRLLLDLDRPTYEKRALDEGAVAPARQPVRIAGPSRCSYLRPIRRNPLYAAIDAPALDRYRGCAFCTRSAEAPDPGQAAWNARGRFRAPPVERLLRQIEAHQRDAPPGDGPTEYLVEDGVLGSRPAALLDAIVERGLAPARLYVLTRADSLVAQRARLEAVLPRAAAAGHELRVLSIGAENFSPPENERFHKGVRIETLWVCHALLQELEERFPGTFACPEAGYFAAILFTPWTRPEDVMANVEAARRLGAEWLRTALRTRLQLLPEAAITALARHDGLTTEGFESAGEIAALCLSGADAREVPWRFADPRTERLHRVLIRLKPLPDSARFGVDDPLCARIDRWRAALPPHFGGDLLALAAALVAAAAAHPADGAVDDDIEQILARVAADAPPPPPEEAPAAPVERPALDPDAPWAWAVTLVRRIEARRPARLQGYRLRGVVEERDEGGDHLSLRFTKGDTEFHVTAARRAARPDGWRVGRRFTLVHAPDTPPGTAAEARLADLLVAAFDRFGP